MRVGKEWEGSSKFYWRSKYAEKIDHLYSKGTFIHIFIDHDIIYILYLYSKGTGLNNDLSFEDVQGHGEDTQV